MSDLGDVSSTLQNRPPRTALIVPNLVLRDYSRRATPEPFDDDPGAGGDGVYVPPATMTFT